MRSSHASLASLLAKLALLATPAVLTTSLSAQIGGNGSDGAFQPAADTTLDTTGRPQGWNFTTIRIPSGVTVTFVGSNPVILRAQGDIAIEGWLLANGGDGESDNGIPGAPPPAQGPAGPGGFRGGFGDGEGPGGGQGGFSTWNGSGRPNMGGSHATEATTPFGGLGATIPPTYGSHVPFDMRGGSGGGGFSSRLAGATINSTGAGGGGVVAALTDGALRVASSGGIRADGGTAGAPGSGGSVLLRAVGAVQVFGTVSAAGFDPGFPFGSSGNGYVRIDTYGLTPQIGGADIVGELRSARLPLLGASDLTIGQTATIDLATRVGDSGAIFLAFRSAFTPTPFGQLRLGNDLALIGSGASSTGAVESLVSTALPVPANPALQGRRVFFQGIAFDSSGFARLSDLQTRSIQ